MRRTLPLLLLALGALALCSCGKGGVTTVTVESSPAGASTTPGSAPKPSRKPARARALAYARAVNLTAEDVPGFTAQAHHDNRSAREKRLEREMVRCAGGAALHGAGGAVAGEAKPLVEQSSKDFELKHGVIDFSVSSQVSVQPDAAEARKALQAIRSPRVRNCFSRYLRLAFEGQHLGGATVGPVKIQAGVPPAPGTSGGFGWRITASFALHGVQVPIYLDFLGFVDGPAEVTLLSSGLIRPFPAEVQQQLFSLLLARAKGHRL